MKWSYTTETLREVTAKGGSIEGDVVEALRAIAEQLQAMNSELVVIAAELIKQNELEAGPTT